MHIKKFFTNEDGATAIEYGLIGALIAVAIVVGATSLGSSIDTVFTDTATKVEEAANTTYD